MIVIDTSAVLGPQHVFCRGAGILGFSVFARTGYLLSTKTWSSILTVWSSFSGYEGEDILLFGLYMIWQHFYNKLKELDLSLDLSRAS